MIWINVGFILILCLVYGYLNGLHGSASIAATMISSRATSPRNALMLATVGIALGPFVFGVAVANTIGTQLITAQATTVQVIMAALAGAIIWSSLTLWFKLPTSISQSLVGGLFGAVIVGYGSNAIMLPGFLKIMLALFLSPILGVFVGFGLVRLCYRFAGSASPSISRWFNRAQVLVSMLLAMSFGANDGQKIMGMVVLGMVASGAMDGFSVPLWVIVFSTFAISLGTFVGGWRLINTLGRNFYKIRPVHGFGSQFASATVLLCVGVLGGPVSGSQVITSAIVGAGSADRIQKIRWGVVQRILASWLLTIPISGAISGIIYLFLRSL